MENNIMIHFETLEDPRQQSKVLHPMKNIVFIVLVGALNGLDGWEEIADFAEYRRDFLEKYLDVVFGEDSSLKRVKNSAENFNIVRKIVLGLLKNDGIDYGKKKVSLKRRMLHAIHDDGYLENLLQRL